MCDEAQTSARTIKMTVAYDGTDFCGWQTQPGQRTVQDEIEQVLRRVVNHPLTIHGAGRTDSGVHAAGQVAHFVTTSPIPVHNIQRALASRMPPDISIVRLREVHPEFHATQSAVSKLYRYRLWNHSHRPTEHLLHRYTYHCWRELDLRRMQEAGQLFVGHQDFAALASKSGQPRRTTWRTVFRCDVYRHFQEVRIDVEGSGFLYNMVRNIAGTLVEVGRGRWAPDHIGEILASGNRSNAGQTLPARGLCMQWVKYVPGVDRPHRRERDAEYVDETDNFPCRKGDPDDAAEKE